MVAASIFIDTLTAMACGALLATVAVAWHGAAKTRRWRPRLGMFLVDRAAGDPGRVRLDRQPAGHRPHQSAGGRATARRSRWQVLLVGWLSIAGGWLMQGLSLWAVLRAVGATDEGPLANWPLHTAAAALAVVAGFLTMIPGGLGGARIGADRTDGAGLWRCAGRIIGIGATTGMASGGDPGFEYPVLSGTGHGHATSK